MNGNYELRMRNYELVKKYLICFEVFLIVFCFSTDIFAQESLTITNYFTDRYRDFPMSKVSIIPAKGFEKDSESPGFINRKYASAIRSEEMHAGILETSKNFFNSFDSIHHKDSLGVLISNSLHVLINGFSAYFSELSGNIDGENYSEQIVIIGDNANSYILKGYFPAEKKSELEKEMRTSLLSVFYEPDRRILPPGADATTTSSSACSCHNQK
jgi:hypothetical protein